MAVGGFRFATVRPTARLVMSWSDANTEYRWYTPSSLVAVRRADSDQNGVTSGVDVNARQQELIDKETG